MRLDLFVKNNILLLLKNNSHFSNLEKKELLKLSRSFWQKEIILGNIKFKNKFIKPSFNISLSEKYLININWKIIKKDWNTFYRDSLLGYPIPLNLISTNPEFLIVNKPAGISVHPAFPLSFTKVREVSLIEGVMSRFGDIASDKNDTRPGIVHRLDKETSGIMLIARNPKTKAYFQKQFKKHSIKKTYYALVEGDFPYGKFSIEGKIGKNPKKPLLREMGNVQINNLSANKYNPFIHQSPNKKIINPKDTFTLGDKIASGSLQKLEKVSFPGNKIFTTWKKHIHSHNKIFTLLGLLPQTGRTHQLRVQLSAGGFPIVGDKLYSKSNNKNLPFHCLHAYSLYWNNPAGSAVFYKSPEIILF